MIAEQQVKNEQIKRKQTCPASFVKAQDHSKEFPGNDNKKYFLENPLVTMIVINMGGQRSQLAITDF